MKIYPLYYHPERSEVEGFRCNTNSLKFEISPLHSLAGGGFRSNDIVRVYLIGYKALLRSPAIEA